MGATSILAMQQTGGLAGHFGWIDWTVVLAYFVFTTVLGGVLAGRQATIRDFFLGGRKLPWYAVAGSIVATEISALTFISVPWVVYSGDFTYLQLGVFGSFFARIVVGYVLVPAYYKREIYSPYDYMGNQLGSGVRSMTTALFSLSGMLAQSARVYLTAVVLELILHEPLGRLSAATGIHSLVLAIWIVLAVALLWTLMGGITTVIWTDVILFFVFLIGAVVALIVVAYELPGGLTAGFGEIFAVGWQEGKFRFIDTDPSPIKTYTIWTAAIASTWGGLGAYGTDQLLAQRMFCCKDARDARWAIIASTAGQIVTATVMLTGVGLFVYYSRFPMEGEALALFQQKGDRIFPIFILTTIPAGLTGLIIAGVFAAAVSSLDSILAALSQTSMSAFYLPWRERYLQRRALAGPPGFEVAMKGDALTAPENPQGPPDRPPPEHVVEATQEDRFTVLVSRGFVVFWAIILGLMAQLAIVIADYYPSILDLGLAMAGYAGGGLLAGFLLGFLPLNINGRGYLWSAPLSVVTVFAIAWNPNPDPEVSILALPFTEALMELWNQYWVPLICWIAGAILLAFWIAYNWKRLLDPQRQAAALGKTLALLIGIAVMILIGHFGYFEVPHPETGEITRRSLAWPWFAPAGSVVAFVLGYLLADRREDQAGMAE